MSIRLAHPAVDWDLRADDFLGDDYLPILAEGTDHADDLVLDERISRLFGLS